MNNDRFKFRVWTDNGYINNGIALIGNTSHDTLIACQGNSIIEQCTGLRDKNGSLIYEGDLCIDFYMGKKRTSEIVFHHGRLCVKSLEDFDNWNYADLWQWVYPKSKIEIIGNIHENSGVAE